MGLGLVVLAGAATACGGQVKGGSSDPAENMPAKTPPKVASGGSAMSADNPDADTDLGDCQLGPPENGASDDPCPWVADNRCYQTREMACNCACPRSHDSLCASGFDGGPNGHVWVGCQ
jgi:hypothetical protein